MRSLLGSRLFLSKNWPFLDQRGRSVGVRDPAENRRFLSKRAGHLPLSAEKALSVNSSPIHQKFGRPRLIWLGFLHIFFLLTNYERGPLRMRVTTRPKPRSGNREEKGMKPGGPCQLLSCRTSNSSDDRKGVSAEEKGPHGLLLALCIPVQASCGAVSLRQTRCDDMPDATKPFAIRLARTRIT